MAKEDVASTYARAIFEEAVARWHNALYAVDEALDQSDSMTVLDDTASPFEKKKELVEKLLPASADAEVRNFVYLLASNNHIHLLKQILEEFDRLAARGPGFQMAHVTTAVELTETERKQIEQKIRAQFGKEIDIEFRVDKSLLGGVVVRVGDRVIDGSIAGKLAAMRQQLESTR